MQSVCGKQSKRFDLGAYRIQRSGSLLIGPSAYAKTRDQKSLKDPCKHSQDDGTNVNKNFFEVPNFFPLHCFSTHDWFHVDWVTWMLLATIPSQKANLESRGVIHGPVYIGVGKGCIYGLGPVPGLAMLLWVENMPGQPSIFGRKEQI